MSGRHEKEMRFEKITTELLKNLPSVMTEYYYSLVGAGKSYTTIYNYINYVRHFIDYTFPGGCKENFYLDVKPIHINKYVASLRTKIKNGEMERTSDSIKGVQWSALNVFFQFLIPEYISSNPVAATQRPKNKDNPHVTYLNPNEITKILNNIQLTASEKTKNRDLCILKLGFSTGLRVSAIVQIDLEDIDFDNNQIKVTEKGDYDNYVMFGSNLKNQLLLWLQDREKYYAPCDTNALFVSQWGTRMGVNSLARILSKYSQGVTDKHVTPHVMRHSCATNLYEKTGDIYLCAKQLNHKQVSTTQRYAELSQSRQREATNILDDLI